MANDTGAQRDENWITTLSKLLEKSGAKVTFSINCCSGIVSLVGLQCECWRCREFRGEKWTEETEQIAERISARAQKALREKIKSDFERRAISHAAD